MLDERSRAQSFPTLSNSVYLNTAAEGIPPVEVGEALAQYFRDKQLGMDGRDAHFAAWSEARKLVGDLFGLSADEVGICSCSSEAFQLAAQALQLESRDEVVLNDLDFPAGATPWLTPTSRAGVRLWKSRGGRLSCDDLVPLLSSRTRLVTVSLVSFYNGFLLPLNEVADAVRQHSDALLAVDVTQALGRIPLNLSQADLIVSSTHKWILSSHGGGLVGVPARRASDFHVHAGGWHNLVDAFGPRRFEKAVSLPGAAGFMVGMPNFPAIYALRAALGYLASIGVPAIHAAAQPLVERCARRLAELPVELITPTEPANLSGILAFRHPDAERIARRLREKQIHLMHHAGRLRISLHGYNTSADVDQFLLELEHALA